MARKDLLKGLIGTPGKGDASEPSEPTRVDAAKPRYSTGAIGAVSQQIAELKSRALAEIDPRMIDNAGLTDRLGDDPDHAALVDSIRKYGQQVPVLLRPNPNDPERYQVVYGRRRVAALKELGVPIKALVRILDDKELILAQGQENAARRDLTFIEKANFARQMRDTGYDRKTICDALHMDKTLLSRMLSVADKIPTSLVMAIGAAPSVGRDRWMVLAAKIGGRDLLDHARGDTSDARFDAVMAALKTPKPAARPPRKITTGTGQVLATVKRTPKQTTLTLAAQNAEGFEDWLVQNLARLHATWRDEERDKE